MLIIFSSRGVLSSINLNHEPLLVAEEVDEIRANRLLPSKAMTVELSSSDVVPKNPLCVRCILPKRS